MPVSPSLSLPVGGRRQSRTQPRTRTEVSEEPFESAEHAWFWCVHALALRRAGARLDRDGGRAARPCEPDDIIRALGALERAGRLRPVHVQALATFGANGQPPDGRVDEDAWAVGPWAYALDELAVVLTAKGIVA